MILFSITTVTPNWREKKKEKRPFPSNVRILSLSLSQSRDECSVTMEVEPYYAPYHAFNYTVAPYNPPGFNGKTIAAPLPPPSPSRAWIVGAIASFVNFYVLRYKTFPSDRQAAIRSLVFSPPDDTDETEAQNGNQATSCLKSWRDSKPAPTNVLNSRPPQIDIRTRGGIISIVVWRVDDSMRKFQFVSRF